MDEFENIEAPEGIGEEDPKEIENEAVKKPKRKWNWKRIGATLGAIGIGVATIVKAFGHKEDE